MQRLLLCLLLNLISINVFANSSLPPVDYSTVASCTRGTMLNSNISKNQKDYSNFFQNAAVQSDANPVYANDHNNNCSISFNAAPICRYVNKTENEPDVNLTPVYSAYKPQIKAIIDATATDYAASKAFSGAKPRMNLVCKFQCNQTIVPDRDCVATLVE